MSYSEHVAKVIADQLERFVTLNRHQLAGHVANLDFWLAEARHALDVIDNYQARFKSLKAAEMEFVARHDVKIDTEFHSVRPSPPYRVADAARDEARKSVTNGLYRFLLRLYRERLIAEAQWHSILSSFDIGIDPADVRYRDSSD